MTSFIGIATANDKSLADDAPGIAEALAATAVGLAAAIPAAFAYNRLAAAFSASGRRVLNLAEEKALRISGGADDPAIRPAQAMNHAARESTLS
jgi:biopolymer transport protein ExbB/TolQ